MAFSCRERGSPLKLPAVATPMFAYTEINSGLDLRTSEHTPFCCLPQEQDGSGQHCLRILFRECSNSLV